MAMSLIFFLIYWAFLIAGENFADKGKINPILSMWLPNIVLFTIGIYLNVKIGDYIRTGEENGVIFNSDEKKLDENLLSFQSCFKISNQLVELNNLIIDYS